MKELTQKQIQKETTMRQNLQTEIINKFGEEHIKEKQEKLCKNYHSGACNQFKLLPITSEGKDCPYYV